MDKRIVRGRKHTFETWVVDIPGDAYLYTFGSLRKAKMFLRLVDFGVTNHMAVYTTVVDYPLKGNRIN